LEESNTINISEIKGFKEIVNSVEAMVSIEKISYSNECDTKIQDEGFKKSTELYKELTESEKCLLDELLNGYDGKEYTKINIDNIEETSKAKVLDYMYWYYRNDKNKKDRKKVDLVKAKKAIEYKGNKYKTLLKFNIICKMCNKEMEISTADYTDKKIRECKCSHCNHVADYFIRRILPCNCKCAICKKTSSDLYNSIKKNLGSVIEEIEIRLRGKISKVNLKSNIPSDSVMAMDHKMYKLDLDRDIREIMSYSPKNIDELWELILKLEVRYKNHDKKTKYRDMIIKKLLKYKIIYSVEIVNDNLLEEGLVNKMTDITINSYSDVINNINALVNNEPVTLNVEYEKWISSNRYRGRTIESHIRIGMNNIELNFYENGIINIKQPKLTEFTYMINKYFFESDQDIIIERKSNHIKNIFNSDVEKSEYIDLRNKYTEYIVLPNYKIKDIINLKDLKTLLTDKEFAYLINDASFNFVICDLEGDPLKVIQTSRHPKHNTEEWIEKDRIKKHVCKIIGLEFEEIF